MKIIIEFNENGILTIDKDDNMSGLELLGILDIAKNTVINPRNTVSSEEVEEMEDTNDMQ